MYIQREGMGGVFDIFTGIGEVGADWLKKQLGMPTGAEERAKAQEAQIEAQKQIAQASIFTQAQMQKYMLYAGAGVLAIGVVAFVMSMQKPKMIPVQGE